MAKGATATTASHQALALSPHLPDVVVFPASLLSGKIRKQGIKMELLTKWNRIADSFHSTGEVVGKAGGVRVAEDGITF